ncbi:MAG: DUF2059 domain-containing protein [Hyphomonadaceae bacterium]|jgi:hypothetical protein|nr:DUF2059 domain-containing protein [Hyphomonadaceae bacterium]
MTYRALFVLVVSIFAVAALPEASRAQGPDPARIAAAKQMMVVAGAASQFDQVMPLIAEQMSQSFAKVAPDKANEIADVFRQLVPRFIDRKGVLLDQIAALYAAELTLDELKGIIAFYKSPIGAKFAAVQPGIMRQSMTLGQRWGQQIGTELAEEARKELKKRGIDL